MQPGLGYGGQVSVTLDTDVHTPAEQSDVEIEALYEALEKLAQLDPRKAEVVDYRVTSTSPL